jgi:hypothetical protein
MTLGSRRRVKRCQFSDVGVGSREASLKFTPQLSLFVGVLRKVLLVVDLSDDAVCGYVFCFHGYAGGLLATLGADEKTASHSGLY